MSSPFTLWKAAIGVVLYVLVCIVILCFSEPDYAAVARAQCAEHPVHTTAERALKRALSLD
jgi:hypothetical protein